MTRVREVAEKKCEDMTDMDAAYANIHTTRWPGGEIRGQINDSDQKESEH